MRFLMMICALVMVVGVTAAAMPEKATVRYFPSDEVTTAFANGAVLLKQGNYMIHTSKRVAPGMGEVHTKDTDLIYVLEGSATFVTGGKLIAPKNTAADEIRGSGIEGGDTRTIVKGDVIVVPNNTPHWFKEVTGTVLYYTVKVR